MNPYTYLDENLEALKEYIPETYEWLRSSGEELTSLAESVITNNFKQIDLRVDGGRTIFDTLPPDFFYQAWIPGERPHINASIIVGCNLGYGVLHVLHTAPHSHPVFVIEPRPQMLALCLGLTDYSQHIRSGRLAFLPPERKTASNYISRLNLHFIHGSVRLRADTPSQQLGPEYAQWTRLTQNILEGITIELNTLRKRQEDMVNNELGNYIRSFADGSLATLKGVGQGITTLMVGAGPSLNTFGPQIAKIASKALVTTSLQTLPALQNIGLKPHFCVGIDYSGEMRKMYSRLDKKWAATIPLIYSTKVRPEVVEEYPGPKIPLWTVGGLATFVLRKSEPTFEAGGNVNVTLLRFLSWCGVRRFVLVGQDYAWSDNKSHAQGHHSAIPNRVFDPKRHMKSQDMDGNPICTTLAYITAKRDMERDIVSRGLDVYNVYGGGLAIDGSTPIGMEEAERILVAESSPPERFLFALRSAQIPRPRPVFEERAASWNQSFKSAAKRLAKLYRRPKQNHDAILKHYQHMLYFLRQDPLYVPYLYNECMDMAGMARFTIEPTRGDIKKYNEIVARALKKVRHMDSILGAKAKTNAA